MNLEIIPGDRIGNVQINTGAEEIRKLLLSYTIKECEHEYLVICEKINLWLRIHKWHNKVTSIGTDSPQYSFKDRVRVGMEFWEFEENFPDWNIFYATTIDSVPGIEFYFTDEKDPKYDPEENYLYNRIETIAVFDPNVDWEEELKKPHLPCPFTDEEIVERWTDPKNKDTE
jgi:hypothetical protein